MSTDLDRYRDVIIPYRLKAIDTLIRAFEFIESWEGKRKRMEIRFDGKLTIEGTSTGWTNPVIEAGLVHCRAMLEFLGLRLDHRKPDQLKERTNKHPDDVVIEDYGVNGRPLNRVTIADAVAKYAGPPDEAH